MRRGVLYTLAGLVVVLAAIQLIPVDRSNPPAETEIPVPADVRQVLVQSCYDCHSNRTVWPWYSHVAPVSWLVAHDVEEGRKELNFSTWNRYDARREARKLKEIREQVDKGEMPLKNYLFQHPDARLTAEDRTILGSWLTSIVPPGEPGSPENPSNAGEGESGED